MVVSFRGSSGDKFGRPSSYHAQDRNNTQQPSNNEHEGGKIIACDEGTSHDDRRMLEDEGGLLSKIWSNYLLKLE